MADFVKHYGWENVALMSSLDDYGAEAAKSFIAAAPNLRILEHASFRQINGSRQSVKTALTDIKESKARIILTFASAEHFPHIFKQADALGMLNYPYVWILGEQAMLANTFVPDAVFPDGVIALSTHERGTTEFNRFSDDMIARNVSEISYLEHDFFIASAEVYDSVLAIGRALDDVNRKGGNLLNGTQVFQSLLKLPIFYGASGPVAFDMKGDRLYGAVDFFNRVNGSWRQVATWRNESNDTELVTAVLTLEQQIIFLNGMRVAPTDLERLYADWSDGGGLSMVLITCLLLICVAGSAAIIMKHRHNDLIRASSPFFLMATLAGIAFALTSNFFLVGLPTRFCGARYWFLLIGFAVSYGSLVAKNWRVWRLWSDESMKIIRITNIKLFSFLGIFVLPFLVLLVLWSVVDPPVPTFSGHLVGCRSSTGATTWLIVAFAMVLLALGIGSFLSFKVRKIPNLYNECRHIALASYNLGVAITIGLVLHQVLAEISYVASFICWCLGILFGFGGMFIILFGPKFYLVILHPDKISAMSSGRSAGKTTTTMQESSKSSMNASINASVNVSSAREGRGGSAGRRATSGKRKTVSLSASK